MDFCCVFAPKYTDLLTPFPMSFLKFRHSNQCVQGSASLVTCRCVFLTLLASLPIGTKSSGIILASKWSLFSCCFVLERIWNHMEGAEQDSYQDAAVECSQPEGQGAREWNLQLQKKTTNWPGYMLAQNHVSFLTFSGQCAFCFSLEDLHCSQLCVCVQLFPPVH